MWLTVLTTPVRPQYLQGTLANLDAVGGAGSFPGRKILMVDGLSDSISAPPPPPSSWETALLASESQGTRSSLHKILNLAAEAEVPFLLYFEDDVRVCPHAIETMIAIPVPDSCGFLTFCNQKYGYDDQPAIHLRRADDPLNAPGHWGTQAVKIPRRSLQYFARNVCLPRLGRYGSDVFLGESLASAAAPTKHYGIVIPSLVRHVGESTTILAQQKEPFEGHRRGLNYAGDGFDARTLLVSSLSLS